jgi:hypothetical protein
MQIDDEEVGLDVDRDLWTKLVTLPISLE